MEAEHAQAWPPFAHFKDSRIPPPAYAYVRDDDYLAVTVLTSSTTTNLALRYRLLQADGGVIDGAESLDGALAATLKTSIFKLTEGFLLSCTASNIGGALDDNVCGVILAVQKGGQASTPPHTILAQGFVSNIVGVTWPVGLPRGPATSGSALAAAYTDSLIDYPPTSANAQDDEFDAAQLDASWLWDNQGTGTTGATATLTKSRLVLDGHYQSGHNTHALLKVAPAGNWEYTAPIECITTNSANNHAGLMLLETGSDKRLTLGFSNSYLRAETFTAANGSPSDVTYVQWFEERFYARLKRTGVTLSLNYSRDGVAFLELYSVAQTTPFTTAPNRVGYYVDAASNAAPNTILSSDWFRRTG